MLGEWHARYLVHYLKFTSTTVFVLAQTRKALWRGRVGIHSVFVLFSGLLCFEHIKISFKKLRPFSQVE